MRDFGTWPERFWSHASVGSFKDVAAAHGVKYLTAYDAIRWVTWKHL